MERKLEAAIERLFKVNLGLQGGERVLVFTDTIRPDEELSPEEEKSRRQLWHTVQKVKEVGERLGPVSFVSFPATGAHGAEPPEVIWRAAFGDRCVNQLVRDGLLARLLKKQVEAKQEEAAFGIVKRQRKAAVPVVVALSHFSTSHTRFRKLLTKAACTRYASMPLFERERSYRPRQEPWTVLARRTELLRDKLAGQVRLHLTAPNGTDFRLETTPGLAKADTGLLDRPGASGNLPAGEAFTVPLHGSAQGRLVLEWAPFGPMSPPLALSVEQGTVTAVEGENPYRELLEGRFAIDPLARNVAELGIGTNDQASRPDNILESEKILGTVHVALGDNHTMGGSVSTGFHQDFVVFRPTLAIEFPDGRREVLIEEGKVKE